MNDIMYISSSGESKNPKTMNTEYIINALMKAHREIFTLKNGDELQKCAKNIYVLSTELMNRETEYIADTLEEVENGQ